MNPQSIECDCGCWNIVVKVVPPGETCPCGDPKPHDTCKAFPKKRPCDGSVMEETPKVKYNVFQFERCDQCGVLHYVDADDECPAVREARKQGGSAGGCCGSPHNRGSPIQSGGGSGGSCGCGSGGGGGKRSPGPWVYGAQHSSTVGTVGKRCH